MAQKLYERFLRGETNYWQMSEEVAIRAKVEQLDAERVWEYFDLLCDPMGRLNVLDTQEIFSLMMMEAYHTCYKSNRIHKCTHALDPSRVWPKPS